MDPRLRGRAPLALDKRARGNEPLALKNTSHLGQKDARDKRARGNDGVQRE
jgi:hypothetical protein